MTIQKSADRHLESLIPRLCESDHEVAQLECQIRELNKRIRTTMSANVPIEFNRRAQEMEIEGEQNTTISMKQYSPNSPMAYGEEVLVTPKSECPSSKVCIAMINNDSMFFCTFNTAYLSRKYFIFRLKKRPESNIARQRETLIAVKAAQYKKIRPQQVLTVKSRETSHRITRNCSLHPADTNIDSIRDRVGSSFLKLYSCISSIYIYIDKKRV